MEYNTSKVFNKLKRVAKKDLNLTGDLAQFLLDYENDYRNLQIKDIMEQCHVSVASATRLAKMLGYSGFVELKHVLQQEKNKLNIRSITYDNNLSLQFQNDIMLSLKMLYNDFNLENFIKIITDIIKVKNVLIYSDFGLESVFQNFVHKLFQFEINASLTSDSRIINSYLKANDKALVLCFTYKAQSSIENIKKCNLNNVILITPDLIEDSSSLYAFMPFSNLENLNDDIYILEHINLFAILQLFYEYLKIVYNKDIITK